MVFKELIQTFVWGGVRLNKKSVKCRFISDECIEIVVSGELYLALEKKAKLRGLTVESLLSAELLRVRSVGR